MQKTIFKLLAAAVIFSSIFTVSCKPEDGEQVGASIYIGAKNIDEKKEIFIWAWQDGKKVCKEMGHKDDEWPKMEYVKKAGNLHWFKFDITSGKYDENKPFIFKLSSDGSEWNDGKEYKADKAGTCYYDTNDNKCLSALPK